MFARNLSENLESSSEFFIECENGSQISTAVAIVWCTPDCDEVLGREVVLVALLDKLVCSADELELVDMIELCCDSGSKLPTSTSRADRPGFDILGIAPHQITKASLVRNFLSPVDGANLIDCSDIGGEASVNTEHFSIDHSSDVEAIKDLCAVFPGICTSVLSLALVIKSINLGDLS